MIRPHKIDAKQDIASATAADDATKENSGVTARRYRKNRILRSTICFVGMLIIIWKIYMSRGGRARRRSGRTMQDFVSRDATKTTIDAILAGYLTLIDVSVSQESLLPHKLGTAEAEQIRYENVKATFCHIDWKIQGRNPSLVPMFRDLIKKSQLCESTKQTVDFWDITRQAQAYDKANNTDTSAGRVLSLRQPTGVVFHESRCGSTLASNLLVASGQTKAVGASLSRVWPESQPPIQALKACSRSGSCDEEKHHQLIRDVFFMMGRKQVSPATTTNATADHHYYAKFQSISTHYIDSFTKALPSVPWVFLYRDSIEVMQSYWRNANTKAGNAGCARYRNLPFKQQLSKTKLVVEQSDIVWNAMNAQDYCAAHLAGLAESALAEYSNTNTGQFVNYNQLPAVMWESILPDHFHVPVSSINLDAMQEITTVYSKGRGAWASLEWEDDSEQKQKAASLRVQDAAKAFMESRYDRMEQLNTFQKV